ncbi:heparan-alpha-glucosaminide N-acetyltransferase [Hoeflea sp. YIM 152468]|uniref:heparan-alpha-glucosaminide N-acetyltransferase n=1 Tax=Hoeflea sp. YIM 152468 TaxID=3031759 RepID=UPI0023DC3877|nr:heparan-alpha-glucosaminide N-acetyltransferase [Hoeflea sp. YIM 152468]MDF1609960.1 heparan-alpha-glucosaminide N-acetyltransferase [Hoeflea sp. YIM 152468]
MSDSAGMEATAQKPGRRIEVLDLARGLALFAMASYHLSWDSELFGYLDRGTTTTGLFKAYARLIAGSFIFVAGISLVLASRNGVNPVAFLKRLGQVAGAAALISLVTYLAMPDSFIFFGILHAIAAFSLIGLLFLRLPPLFILLVGVTCLMLPGFYRNDLFNAYHLSWIGLFTIPPRSNDLVPLMPWLGPFLLGMGAARLALASGLSERLANVDTGDNPVAAAIRYCGRHSLAFYLVHQPVLLALVWTASQIAPPAAVDPLPGFIAECETGCGSDHSAAFCQRFCVCVTDELLSRELFQAFVAGEIIPETDPRIPAIADQCTQVAKDPKPLAKQ